MTYCALGTLSFLNHTPGLEEEALSEAKIAACTPGSEAFESLIEWLAFRQTNVLYDEDSGEDTEDDDIEDPGSIPPQKIAAGSIEEHISSLPLLPTASQWAAEKQTYAGFNGRTNKISDTCYCFWVTGSLAVWTAFCDIVVLSLSFILVTDAVPSQRRQRRCPSTVFVG